MLGFLTMTGTVSVLSRNVSMSALIVSVFAAELVCISPHGPFRVIAGFVRVVSAGSNLRAVPVTVVVRITIAGGKHERYRAGEDGCKYDGD